MNYTVRSTTSLDYNPRLQPETTAWDHNSKLAWDFIWLVANDLTRRSLVDMPVDMLSGELPVWFKRFGNSNGLNHSNTFECFGYIRIFYIRSIRLAGKDSLPKSACGLAKFGHSCGKCTRGNCSLKLIRFGYELCRQALRTRCVIIDLM